MGEYVASMSTATPIGTVNIDDVSISLVKEELQCKSIVEN